MPIVKQSVPDEWGSFVDRLAVALLGRGEEVELVLDEALAELRDDALARAAAMEDDIREAEERAADPSEGMSRRRRAKRTRRTTDNP